MSNNSKRSYMIKAYSDLAGVSIYYNYFGGADLLISKTQRANAAS